MKFEVKKKVNKSANGFHYPALKAVAKCDSRKEAEDEAKRLNELMPNNYIVDQLNENGAARPLPKVMAKAA